MSKTRNNTLDLWLKYFPKKTPEQHKYHHGHVAVLGGDIDCTGAASLAAIAALRIGAGLVTILSPKNALPVYASKHNAVMVKPYKNPTEFLNLIKDERKNTILLGPGNGATVSTKNKVLAALALNKNCIIDADAISCFQNNPEILFAAIKKNQAPTILTPHMGEFAKLFPFAKDETKISKKTKIDLAIKAAKLSGAVVVLKGAATIIADKDGKIVVSKIAPSYLATAGTGDVLAGIISGLLAQNMPAFYAACAGVYIHSMAAKSLGPGMIADDLPGALPGVLGECL